MAGGLPRAALAALLLVAPAAAAPEASPPDASVQDLLFFGPLRPTWIRLRVTIDGRPFRELWRANLHKLFADADADHDGVLHRSTEASGDKAASQADTTAALADSAAVYLGQDVAAARVGLSEMAAQHGDRLALADFERYFLQAAPPFAIAVGVGRTTAGQALFPLLDVDGDQRLTSDELNGAEARLRIRDFDDNESLTRAELVDAPNSSLAAMAQASDERQSSPLVMAGPVAMFDVARPEIVRAALLAEYDRDGDEALSTGGASAEITPTDGQLARLGAARGEAVTAARLEGFCAGAPDLELKVELGKLSMTNRRASGTRTRRAEVGAAKRVKQRPDGSWDVTLDDAHVYLRRNNRDPSKNADTGPGLESFDADNNGYLDERELANAPGLAGAFETIDTDRDGKIFAAELAAYAEGRNRAAATRLLLEVFDQGQELFDQLDENHDNRLSTRELRSAAEIVKPIDANHDGRLSAGEIPRQLVLELSRNTPGAAVVERRTIRRGERVRAAAKRGPRWFQNLDRNDDGELSAREFLGTAEVFQRLDANRDGVIDADEADVVQ